MKVITFLGLTLLSIVMQFTVISFIEGKIKPDKPDSDDHTIFHQNSDGRNNQKPHALYYRSLSSNLQENNDPTTEYLNVSLLKTMIDITTDLATTTIIDELYDENTSLVSTTDVSYTTTEFENVTEITLFDKKNNATIKPNIIRKKILTQEHCNCNLLYKVCDINCCCDSDCTESDLKIFICGEETATMNRYDNVCHSEMPNIYWYYGNKIIDMFCIAKTNLPEKRNIKRHKHDRNVFDKIYKWHSEDKYQSPSTFTKEPYMYGDHIWVLKNGSIKYMDLPTPVFNSYCTGRKPITFLKEETIKCSVTLKDLEMLEIIKASQEATVVSVLDSNSISSTLDCSTLHCTNWTIIVCEGEKCIDYNKSMHEPSCNDVNCTNLALNFDYIFYYYDSKILNATIKLYIRKVLNIMPFMIQNINVRFVISNETTNVLRMSGNPGYLDGLPVIVSYSKENHSHNFFKSTSSDKYIMHLDNPNGICRITNETNTYLTFNTIKRMKCRFQYEKPIRIFNDTNTCTKINKEISELLGVKRKLFVSPYGNPLNLDDKDWIPLLNDINDKEPVYGEYNEQGSKLHCYNMITRLSYVFTFANTGEKNQILRLLSAKIILTAGNVTFNIEDITVVLTIDTMFIDETKPTVYEYAAAPHLNIYLPRDFFFPFPNSRSNKLKYNIIISIVFNCLVFLIQQIK